MQISMQNIMNIKRPLMVVPALSSSKAEQSKYFRILITAKTKSLNVELLQQIAINYKLIVIAQPTSKLLMWFFLWSKPCRENLKWRWEKPAAQKGKYPFWILLLRVRSHKIL